MEERRWNGIWITKSSEDPVLELCTFIYVRVSGQWGSYRMFREGTGTGGYMRWRIREGSRYGKKVCVCSSSVRCVPCRHVDFGQVLRRIPLDLDLREELDYAGEHCDWNRVSIAEKYFPEISEFRSELFMGHIN